MVKFKKFLLTLMFSSTEKYIIRSALNQGILLGGTSIRITELKRMSKYFA